MKQNYKFPTAVKVFRMQLCAFSTISSFSSMFSLQLLLEAHSEPNQTSTMKFSTKTVQLLKPFIKSSILDV